MLCIYFNFFLNTIQLLKDTIQLSMQHVVCSDMKFFLQYIKNFYHEDPDTYSYEVGVLEALRAGAVRPERDVVGVANLKRYYCQLHFLMSRFPMTKDGAAAVLFGWCVTFSFISVSYILLLDLTCPVLPGGMCMLACPSQWLIFDMKYHQFCIILVHYIHNLAC